MGGQLQRSADMTLIDLWNLGRLVCEGPETSMGRVTFRDEHGEEKRGLLRITAYRDGQPASFSCGGHRVDEPEEFSTWPYSLRVASAEKLLNKVGQKLIEKTLNPNHLPPKATSVFPSFRTASPEELLEALGGRRFLSCIKESATLAELDALPLEVEPACFLNRAFGSPTLRLPALITLADLPEEVTILLSDKFALNCGRFLDSLKQFQNWSVDLRDPRTGYFPRWSDMPEDLRRKGYRMLPDCFNKWASRALAQAGELEQQFLSRCGLPWALVSTAFRAGTVKHF